MTTAISEHEMCSHMQTVATSMRQLSVEFWISGAELLAACGQCQRVVTVETYPPNEEAS